MAGMTDTEGMRYHTVDTADAVVVETYHAEGTVYAGKYHVVGMGMNQEADAGMYHVADAGMSQEADVLSHMEGMGYCHEEDYP
jgi:hypothetical protein